MTRPTTPRPIPADDAPAPESVAVPLAVPLAGSPVLPPLPPPLPPILAALGQPADQGADPDAARGPEADRPGAADDDDGPSASDLEADRLEHAEVRQLRALLRRIGVESVRQLHDHLVGRRRPLTPAELVAVAKLTLGAGLATGAGPASVRRPVVALPDRDP